MNPFLIRSLPLLTSGVAIALVGAVELWNPKWAQRFEAVSYDWRVRLAIRYPASVATNLGFVFMSDESIARISDGSVHGFTYGLYWPRHLYGRVVEELTAQGARAIAFDILMPQRRTDHPPAQLRGMAAVKVGR